MVKIQLARGTQRNHTVQCNPSPLQAGICSLLGFAKLYFRSDKCLVFARFRVRCAGFLRL